MPHSSQAHPPPTSSDPVVTTTVGRVSGEVHDGVLRFQGVPYAAPPVGPRRYRLPESPDPWDGVRPCTTPGPSALQGTPRRVANDHYPLPEAQDEDCLYLNLWTSGTDEARRPVFVYVHGGGYFLGSATSEYLDGAAYAREDIVFLSITYRLNGLGFLHLDELFDGMQSTGNLGIQDVIRSLEWVQENIAAFGGDPSRVTVGGHSSGGLTTVALLASPRAQGLFHRAVPVSCAAGHNTLTAPVATAVARRVLREVGIEPGDTQALLAAPAQSLLVPNTIVGELHEIAGGHPLDPVADGRLLHERAIDALRAGQGASVDLLIGTTTEEFRLIVFDEHGEVRDEPLAMGVSAAGLDYMGLFEGSALTREQIEEVYGRSLTAGGREHNAAELFAAAGSDHVMFNPSAEAAAAHAANGGRSYAYRFAWRPPAGGGLVGAQHGNDIPFFFHRPNTGQWRHVFCGAAPLDLGHAYFQAIVAFTRSGDPSHDGLPHWPRYEASRRATMMFDTTTTLVEDPERERRELMEAAGAYRD
jgi:para-nitrobenzyl esterase